MNNTNIIYKPGAIKKEWFVIDATNLVLGRLASKIAVMLKGKHKATYAPNMDCGDNIVVINCEKIHMTGRKMHSKFGKKYYRHTGYPGGIKCATANDIINGKTPEKVIRLAVTRMLKKTKLRHNILRHLYVYKGGEHPHAGQCPKEYDFGSLNTKNKKNIQSN